MSLLINERFDANTDIEMLESILKYESHIKYLRTLQQINYINIKSGHKNKYMFKMYVFENNKWVFDDWGHLKLKVVNNVPGGFFFGLESKILKFTLLQPQFCLRKHDDSDQHILVTDINNKPYLLMCAYSEVIDCLFETVFK